MQKGSLDTYHERRDETAPSKVAPDYHQVEDYRDFVIWERTDVNPPTFWILFNYPIASNMGGLQHVGGHAYASLDSARETIDHDPDLQKIKQGIRDLKTSPRRRPGYTQ